MSSFFLLQLDYICCKTGWYIWRKWKMLNLSLPFLIWGGVKSTFRLFKSIQFISYTFVVGLYYWVMIMSCRNDSNRNPRKKILNFLQISFFLIWLCANLVTPLCRNWIQYELVLLIYILNRLKNYILLCYI